jgi:hypothetical protein
MNPPATKQRQASAHYPYVDCATGAETAETAFGANQEKFPRPPRHIRTCYGFTMKTAGKPPALSSVKASFILNAMRETRRRRGCTEFGGIKPVSQRQ